MNSRRREARAFTLLELLVAMTMTAVLAGSLYATLGMAFQARRVADEAVGDIRRLELTMELMRADIRSAVVPSGILAGEFIGIDESEEAGEGLGDSLLLHCTADGGVLADGAGDIRTVEFVCEADEDGEGMVLLRRMTSNLLTTKVLDPVEEVLCRGVDAFELRYFDGVDWLDNWDSGNQDNALPLAVEVTVRLVDDEARDDDEGGLWVSRVFRVPCSSITPGAEIEVGF